MQRKCMLTTNDNPYDPFKQFSEWLIFDSEKGYNTCSYLARIARTSDDNFSIGEYNEEIERAIDEIIKYDFMNVYKKVVQETEEDDEYYFPKEKEKEKETKKET